VAGRRSGLSGAREVGSSGALPPGVSRRSLRVRARSCSCAKRSEKTISDEERQQRTDGQERDLTSETGGERERQEETKRDLRQTKQWTTSTNRATQQATASKKVSQTFSQIRPHMSVFFCTASSRLSLGRRLRRRLGGRVGTHWPCVSVTGEIGLGPQLHIGISQRHSLAPGTRRLST
jgi:hypothetical protein